MKTKWNLTLLYKFPTDPRIERDIAEIKNAYEQFAKKYRNKTDYLKNEKGLLRVLTDYEKLIAKVGGGKPLAYFEYSRTLDSTDQKMVSRCNQLHDQLTMASNKILFFELSLGKIEKRLQKRKYSKKKIRENLDSEIFQVCLEEAKKKGHKVVKFDVEKKVSLVEIVNKIKKKL